MTAARKKTLSHVSSRGEARMVDVGDKAITHRVAVARAEVRMTREAAAQIRGGSVAKGDVLATARIAGIQAAKRTPDWIPLCHTLALTRVTVDFAWKAGVLRVTATAEARDRTGVEMEAMVAASAAALTVYDMLKAVDRAITFEVSLLEKSGGKSGHYQRPAR